MSYRKVVSVLCCVKAYVDMANGMLCTSWRLTIHDGARYINQAVLCRVMGLYIMMGPHKQALDSKSLPLVYTTHQLE